MIKYFEYKSGQDEMNRNFIKHPIPEGHEVDIAEYHKQELQMWKDFAKDQAIEIKSYKELLGMVRTQTPSLNIRKNYRPCK